MLNSIKNRLVGSVVLAPAIFVVLIWFGRYSASEEIAKTGIASFVLLTAGVSIVVAYCLTMFIAFLKQEK
jgi:hypothetical protein